jgi:inosine triphosphate pyrophosphatase
MGTVIFVTGNQGKLKEVQQILGGYGIQVQSQKVEDLPELQGEPDEITRDKCLRAYKALSHVCNINTYIL